MEKRLTEYAYKPDTDDGKVGSETNSGDDSSPKQLMNNDSFFQINNGSRKTGPTTATNNMA